MSTITFQELALKVDPKRIARRAWVFSNEVDHVPDAQLSNDKCAFVYLPALNRFGIYSKTSLNSVRLFPRRFLTARNAGQITQEVVVQSIVEQLKLARTEKLSLLGTQQDEAFRWIHGDADGLPGVILDDYVNCLVIQFGSRAGEFLKDYVFEALSLLDSRPLFERSSGQSRTAEGLPERTRWVSESATHLDTKVTAPFSGLKLSFNLNRAQKTGLFLDQRENLNFLRSILANKSVTSSLDVCCYAGAWSSVIAQAGARDFTLIDQDKNALEFAKANIHLNAKNQIANVETLHGDMFESLSKLGNLEKTYSVVVADPPAFAKSAKHVPEARRAYARMSKLASRLVEKGGILIVCSCSRNMLEDEFYELVSKNLHSGDWVLLARGGQARDHSVGAFDDFSRYLKCFFFMRRE